MAGGRGNNKRSGNLDRTRQWLRHQEFYSSAASEARLSEIFRKYQRAEKDRTDAKCSADLQDNILRIFTGSLHCDLNIIHGYNVIRTNQCIIKTRSPNFYEALRPYFVHTNKTIDCIVDRPGVFHQIEGFVRLLYSNLEFSREERLLVELIASVAYTSEFVKPSDVNAISTINERCEECPVSDCDHGGSVEERIGDARGGYTTADVSASSSNMADSGLETGSVSPHENTTSENSSTDFEELQANEYGANGDLDKIRTKRAHEREQKIDTERYDTPNNYSGACRIRDLVESTPMECASNDHSATCSSFDAEQPQLDSSSSSTEANARKQKLNTEEIYQYENQVLSDPFYESDCASDENESFEFIDHGNASSVSTDPEKEPGKFDQQHPGEKINDQKESNESFQAQTTTGSSLNGGSSKADETGSPAKPQSSCNTSNYYFIDASTLNDEIEVPTASLTQTYSEKSHPYVVSFSTDYTPSRTSELAEEQSCKYTSFKTANLQTGQENVAEFQRELKLSEHLEPVSETRKVKRVDSVSDDKTDLVGSTNKESLAVEIKEADSGESAHPSPCPDNNTIINNETEVAAEKSVSDETKTEKDLEKGGANGSEENQRPSLIRRNTFELDSNDEKLSVLRQEYERRQGNLVFQNAIPQYSGHRVDGDSCFLPPDEPVISVTEAINKFTVDAPIPSTGQYHTMPYIPIDDSKYKINQSENVNTQGSKVVYPVTKSASDKLLVDRYKDPEDSSANCSSSSLPVTLTCILEKESRAEMAKRIKCDETTPIVSGGVSTSDYSKPTDSPTVRRKTESTPIVSGGSVIMNEPQARTKSARMSSSMTAWVVDMSDCNRTEARSVSGCQAGMSQSFSSSECVKKPARVLTGQEKHGSLGFFVNLKDMDAKPGQQQQQQQPEQTRSAPSEKKEQNSGGKPYCEFYVDMSSNKSTAVKTRRIEKEDSNSKSESSNDSGDKKNIFSMFIDIGEPNRTKENDAPRPSHRRSLSTYAERRAEQKSDDTNSSEASTTTKDDQSSSDQKCPREKARPSVFMFIESDSPVVRRRTLSSSRPAFKRHSWNVDKTQGVNANGHVAKELMFRKEHKRAHSLSVDRGDVKKLQAKPSSSSHSLSDTGRAESSDQKGLKLVQEGNSTTNNMDTSTEDVFEFDIRDTPPNSHVEVISEELRVDVKSRTEETPGIADGTDTKAYEDEFSEAAASEKTYTESTEGETRKSETFDISSGSGPPAGGSDNQDFDMSDLLNGDVPNIEIAGQVGPLVPSKMSETHKSLNDTIKKIESELKSPEYLKPVESYNSYGSTITKKTERGISHSLKGLYLESTKPGCSNFVRLSDLDKTPVVSHSTDALTLKEDRSSYRMTNSIPETSWIESKLVVSRTTNGSVRPLLRKFTSIMSTSLPPKQKSPLEELTGDFDGEGITSESDLSSMQSSMGCSWAEGSTEETETSSIAGARPYNRLGEDLLRMFLEEINPDVTINVAGRRIKAHKCILSSRCQYFAALLSGGWVENAGNVIRLLGYSYEAVHFALCHIYSGESNIPDCISIVELASLADMLCLEGLKEVIGYTLKVKYCHLFHKPCQVCSVGVLECMPLAAAYGLDEVYRKSLRWVTKHFVRIWPCKAFATLPKKLMEKCYHQHIVHMSTDNVLQTMMDCDKLLATLPNVRWAEPVFRMVSNLLETSIKFLSDNFAGVLGNENFQSLGRELTWNISRLEDNFLAAAERLPPEQACKSYSKLHKMLATVHADGSTEKLNWGPLFVEFLKKIQSRVEKCLVRDAARAARTTTWLKMDLELRRRIQELACLVILPHEITKSQWKLSNFTKESKAPSTRSTSRSLDLKRVKMAISEHNDRTMKQMTAGQPAKKVLNKPKSDPMERKMQEEKPTATDTVRPKSWPNKIEVKSRYLEPRNKSVPKETTTQPASQERVAVQQRRKIMISSSDSSRTSSPAMKRATEKKPLAKIKLPIKKDVKALSSDSLTEANVSRANSKKDPASKSCGITRPESPSFKQKSTEIGLSVDSLAEPKAKPTAVLVAKKKPVKMDTSMSTDSLMTEITTTPKSSNASNKLSPTLVGRTASKTQIYDRTKKSSPPTQQRSPLTAARRPTRSLESSTAASRSRAAAISAYHGSPSLRRSLLDAAKTPDVQSKPTNNPGKTTTVRQTTTNSQLASAKRDRKEASQGSESPSKRSSPKSVGANRTINKPAITTGKRIVSKQASAEDKGKTATSTKCHNGEATKQQPTVGSRSGTFLKDEPTILKKADIKSSQIDT